MWYILFAILVIIIIAAIKSSKKDNEIKNAASTCSVCNRGFNDIVSKNKYIIKDGVICHDCYYKAKISSLPPDTGTAKLPAFKTKTAEQILEAITPERLAAASVARKEKEEIKKKEAEEALIPKCPKCGSKSLHAGNKKLSIGRAIVGRALTTPLGAAVAATTSQKVIITCLNCGHSWKAGKKK